MVDMAAKAVLFVGDYDPVFKTSHRTAPVHGWVFEGIRENALPGF
jgi:hypothetical protein